MFDGPSSPVFVFEQNVASGNGEIRRLSARLHDSLLITCVLRPNQDFAHEAWNSDKAKSDFAPLIGKTAIYVPEVLWAEKRCMVMECRSPLLKQFPVTHVATLLTGKCDESEQSSKAPGSTT